MRSTATPPKRGGSSPNRGKPRPAGSGSTGRTAAKTRTGAKGGTGAKGRTGARSATPSRPVGRSHTPDPAVFRRRRLLALVILLVVVLGVGLGVQATVRAIDAADDVLPREVSTPIAPESVAEPTGPPTEEELANPVDCRPAAIDLAIGMGAQAVAGATTAMPVTVTNTGQVPCLVDVGGAQVTLTIYSGDDLVWTSQHCSTPGDRRVLLDIGGADTVAFRWTGTRSAPGCPGDQPVAGPGTYRAVVTLVTAAEAPEQLATFEHVFMVA